MHKWFKSTDGLKEAKVDWNEEWEEYRIEFYFKGEWQREATYFTDDKADAIDTAKSWTKTA